MAEVKRIAHKIVYAVETTIGSDPAYTAIANIKAINDHELSRDNVDVTCLANTVGSLWPHPILKVGEIKLTLFWDEADTATQGKLAAYMEVDPQPANTAQLQHQIYFPFGGGTFASKLTGDITKTYTGWIKTLGETVYEVGNEVTRDVTIKITSIPSTALTA